MCFASKPPAPPPPPAPPMRADEENRRAVDEQVEMLRRRPGARGTQMTGALGDTSYGSNVGAPMTTKLGG
jgi:hypothetical protein